MGRLYVSDPPAYKGTFNWRRTDIKASIQEDHPDYNNLDPRTWPCIMQIPYASPLGPYPPSHVAYSQKFMNQQGHDIRLDFRTEKETHTLDLAKKSINWRFFHYPFNFNTLGIKRSKPGIPKADYVAWMTYVNGPQWYLKFPKKDTPTEQSKTSRRECSPYLLCEDGICVCEDTLFIDYEDKQTQETDEPVSKVSLDLSDVLSNIVYSATEPDMDVIRKTVEDLKQSLEAKKQALNDKDIKIRELERSLLAERDNVGTTHPRLGKESIDTKILELEGAIRIERIRADKAELDLITGTQEHKLAMQEKDATITEARASLESAIGNLRKERDDLNKELLTSRQETSDLVLSRRILKERHARDEEEWKQAVAKAEEQKREQKRAYKVKANNMRFTVDALEEQLAETKRKEHEASEKEKQVSEKLEHILGFIQSGNGGKRKHEGNADDASSKRTKSLDTDGRRNENE